MSPDTMEDPNAVASDSMAIADIREIEGERDACRDVHMACKDWLFARGIACPSLAEQIHGQFNPRRNRYADTTEEYDHEYND